MKKVIAMNGRGKQMDDLIKRQDAIIAYCEHECGIKGMTRENCGATDCGTIFDDISPAQQWIPCSERLPGKEKTENDYIAEFIKERHPYMLDSFAFSAWKIKHSCYELGQTFKEAAQENKEAWDSAWNGVDELETDGYTVQQRGTVVTCGINKCKHNDDGLCKAESIYLSEDHDCDGGCDDGWDIDEEEEEE